MSDKRKMKPIPQTECWKCLRVCVCVYAVWPPSAIEMTVHVPLEYNCIVEKRQVLSSIWLTSGIVIIYSYIYQVVFVSRSYKAIVIVSLFITNLIERNIFVVCQKAYDSKRNSVIELVLLSLFKFEF